MSATSTTGKFSSVDKSTKYDRQLRLWGDHGQSKLEAAKVCLINATATGTEIFKNLVLAGIGEFTIVDGNKVTGEDVGSNFFLERSSIGSNRAKVAAELLSELNPDVIGHFLDESPEQILENKPRYFDIFTLVVATRLDDKTLLSLARLLWDAEVPLLVADSYGFLGYMRLVVKEHAVIESHPDSAIPDLRLLKPFPELEEYADLMDLGAMTKKDHSHTPYIIILLKYLDQWKSEHGGEVPHTYQEKKEFKKLIMGGVIENEDGLREEENFDEAVKAVNTALMPDEIPSRIQEIFKDQACMWLTKESKAFWIMARAVKDFVDNEGGGSLPLRGTLPDMTADSDRYVALQGVYRARARRDLERVRARVNAQLQQLGLPAARVDDDDLCRFCRGAAFLHVTRCRSLAQEHARAAADAAAPPLEGAAADDGDDNATVWYALLRAVGRFRGEHSRYPGARAGEVETDIALLKACASRLLAEWGLPAIARDDHIHEVCRYGAAELASVAALVGGASAQEAIKVVTQQFVPLNNTYIYSGITQTSTTLEV